MTARRASPAPGRLVRWLAAAALPLLAGALCTERARPPRLGLPGRHVVEHGPPAWIDPSLAGAADARGDAWIRVVIEHRAQADARSLGRALHARRAPRGEARAAVLRHLERVARAGRDRGLGELVGALEAEGLARDARWVRIRAAAIVTLRASAITRVARHRGVGRVVAGDEPRAAAAVSAALPASAKRTPIAPGPSWAIEALGLASLWADGIDGRGVVVGILDSGVQGTHDALAGGSAGPASWFDPRGAYPEPVDTVPHGTHVLAAAVGRPVGGRPIGAAPAASWVAARSNVDNRYAYADMLAAADWMLFEAAPDVLVGPWGHGAGSCDARDRPLVEAFRAAGCIPVFAAGNGGPAAGTGQAPAALAGFFPDGRAPLSAGAVDRNLRVLPQSARGPRGCGRPDLEFPVVVAPGNLVPLPGPEDSELELASGTSVAAGFSAGVLALALQVAPELPVPVLEDLLRQTARDLPPAGADPASGHGMIDPAAFVDAAASAARSERGPARGAQRWGTFVSTIEPASFISTRGGGAGGEPARATEPVSRCDSPALESTRRTKPWVSR